jgi:DNA polymerase-4
MLADVRQILHIDMDAFYASVEQNDDPSLKGRPVIVGGQSRRGVVSAASYEARPFGVRSAMSMVEALRLCPQAAVVSPRMDRYAEVSKQVFEVMKRYTPLVEGLSLDEAFLDVTASQSLFGDGTEIARRIKRGIKDATGLVASAGVAPCKFVAKVASDLRKPDALVVVKEEEAAAFLAPLPIERMWGIGQKTAPRLRALGYQTLGDLARATPKSLEQALGVWGLAVRDLARGVDPREVDPSGVAKSVGAEETYERDITEREALARTLLDHSVRVAQRMVKEGYSGRTVTVKLKRADFQLFSRQLTLSEPVCDTDSIYQAALRCLDRFEMGPGYRLTGVSVSDLSEGPPPRTLFPDAVSEKRRKLEELTSKLADKGNTLTRATLLEDRHERVAPADPVMPRWRGGR